MQLTKAQRGVVLAVAVVLLAVGLVPWPGDKAPPAEQGSGVNARRVCPAGFAIGDDDTLPAGHPAVPGVGDGSGASALTLDVPAPLEPVTAAEFELLQWITDSGEHAESLLARLVGIDSGTHNKAGVDAVASALEAHLLAAGVAVERRPQAGVGDHLLASVRCGVAAGDDDSAPPPPRVLLTGHMDTVYADGTAASRPYRREGNLAYGPGVSDMKDGLVAAALVLEAAQRYGCAGAGPLLLQALFTSDEEVGSVVSRDAIAAAAAGAAAVLNLESGSADGAVAAARKASLTLRFEVAGVAAHAGNAPHEGASAVEAFARKTLRMHALNAYRVGVPGVKGVDGVTVSVGTVEGGSAPNVVPDRVTATVNARAWTAAGVAALNATLRGIIQDTADVAGTSGRVLEEALFPPFEQTPASTALLTLYRRAVATMGLPDVPADRRGGAADSAFASAAGAPTLCAVGPLGDGAHSPEEFLLFDSLLLRTQMVAFTALRIARAAAPLA